MRRGYLWAEDWGWGGRLLCHCKDWKTTAVQIQSDNVSVQFTGTLYLNMTKSNRFIIIMIIIIQWLMCLKCGALYPVYVKSGVVRKQTAELTCFLSSVFGCYSYVHQFIWFHKCWFITNSSSLHIRWRHLFSGSRDSRQVSVRGELEDHITKPLLKIIR